MTAEDWGVAPNNFGELDQQLAEGIGVIAMLGALIEVRVEALCAQLDGGPQDAYTGWVWAKSADLAENHISLYRAANVNLDFADRAAAALHEVGRLMPLRNEIVHRVWSKATILEWAGWKGNSKNQTTDWRTFTRETIAERAAAMSAVVAVLGDVIGGAGSARRIAVGVGVALPEPTRLKKTVTG